MADSLISSYVKNHQENSTGCYKLELIQLQLREVPSAMLDLTSLQELSLDYNRITVLPEEFCSNLRRLSVLSLSGNNLTTLPNNIHNLSNLKHLSLNENSLTKLPQSFAFLRNLETLKLVGNALKKLPSNFGDLQELTHLSVDENCLKELPTSFASLKNLERLDASQNKLKFLPEAFGILKSLMYLDLSGNCLTSLPESFHLLPKLSMLDLTDNLITSLPEKFASAQGLTTLYADNNNLNEIPEWFSQLENVEELSLQNNHLRNAPFPTDFGRKSSRLRNLDLRGNYISSLPDTFGELKCLEIIDMGSILPEPERRRSLFNGNFLVHLPFSFGYAVTLKEVHLDENTIEDLPDSFGCLVNLETLDLNHNKLSHLPDSFCNLKLLTVCMLSINSLVDLPKDFGNLQNLTELRLDNNMLTELPKSFSRLENLHTLDLYCNSLKTLPGELKYLTNLKRLDLNENCFGIPILEVPEISFKAQYRDRDPNMKDNWRGRRRADILDCQIVQDDNQNKAELQHLHTALERGLSLWKKHGQEDQERLPAVNGDCDHPTGDQNSICSTDSDDDDDKYWIKEPTSDVEVDSCIVTTEVASTDDTEFWDLESNDPFGYFEDEVPRYTIPAEPLVKPFIPSDSHPAPFKVQRIFVNASKGQFDDAD